MLVVYVGLHSNQYLLDFFRTDPDMKGAQCTLSHPHSNAAVDLNGDCLAGKLFGHSNDQVRQWPL